ncbi:MAG: hypothetical protein AB1796_06275 [Bacillota bacterium]
MLLQKVWEENWDGKHIDKRYAEPEKRCDFNRKVDALVVKIQREIERQRKNRQER